MRITVGDDYEQPFQIQGPPACLLGGAGGAVGSQCIIAFVPPQLVIQVSILVVTTLLWLLVCAGRFRNMDMSSWMALLTMVPIIGFVVVLYTGFASPKSGTPEGEDTKGFARSPNLLTGDKKIPAGTGDRPRQGHEQGANFTGFQVLRQGETFVLGELLRHAPFGVDSVGRPVLQAEVVMGRGVTFWGALLRSRSCKARLQIARRHLLCDVSRSPHSNALIFAFTGHQIRGQQL